MLQYELNSYKQGKTLVCGVDEAGRGPLAGPVVAAAVILPKEILLNLTSDSISEENHYFSQINDSKKIAPKKREKLFQFLQNDDRIIKAIGIVNEKVIDEINIFQATLQAMKEAISKLHSQPDHILLDGLQPPESFISSLKSAMSCEGIVKGDSKSLSIAAASILAKVTRDQMMLEYDQLYPEYGFAKHKGYGTKEHMNQIKERGPSAIHRMSFAPMNQEPVFWDPF